MDGYTFMIERNRRLIELEVRQAEQRSRETSEAEARETEATLAADIRKLYVELEGCGRGAKRASNE